MSWDVMHRSVAPSGLGSGPISKGHESYPLANEEMLRAIGHRVTSHHEGYPVTVVRLGGTPPRFMVRGGGSLESITYWVKEHE